MVVVAAITHLKFRCRQHFLTITLSNNMTSWEPTHLPTYLPRSKQTLMDNFLFLSPAGDCFQVFGK